MGSGVDAFEAPAQCRRSINKKAKSVSSWSGQGRRWLTPISAAYPRNQFRREDMQDQGNEEKASESNYGKRHHSIDTPPSPPNTDPPAGGDARPPYGGPDGGKEHKNKK
jgi:hypothetical protein